MFGMHPDPGEPQQQLSPGQETPSGEPRLQLSPHKAEQGVSEEGALQGQKEIPFDAGYCGSHSGLYLRQSHNFLLEGIHPHPLSQWHTTVHVVFVLKCTKSSGKSNSGVSNPTV